MNTVNLMGRPTTDLELSHTQSGKAVTSFTLAVNGVNDHVDFVHCVVWNKLAEIMTKYVKKGVMIGVTGSLQVRDYTNKDGQRREASEVVINSFDFGERKKREEKATSDGQDYDPHEFEEVFVSNDGDLPF